MGDFWVFGYGSLLWRPGFEFVEEHMATLHGKHRALCVHSWVHRGTQERPGLVLGLDHGGSCHGIARRVSGEKRDVVIAYLRERELVTHVYLEKWLKIRLLDGRKVRALTYVVDRKHEQYAPPQPLNELAGTIAGATGKSGANRDYVLNTVKSLNRLGIRDHVLEKLCSQL
ncbi:gamma-glutamylcyclotransferase [Salaquimonas pukyongi]|uniref:gamma-glutamylcyclotransferase n=1 Tax=Salaquimonas pukyongi TaxID=2712698 RepID=UPI00096BBEE4|nr:gamma-glutamylcyclotransferase [Salaquimonas pukyongi]